MCWKQTFGHKKGIKNDYCERLVNWEKTHSPAGPLREYDVVRVQGRVSLHELHARLVLPVTHRLLEQGPVLTCAQQTQHINKKYFIMF